MKRTDEEVMNLYNVNEKLIYATIHRRYSNYGFQELHGLDGSDIEQYGKMGLYKACQEYDPSKGTKFSSFAISHINWSILTEAKRDSLGNENRQSFDLIDRTSLDKKQYDSEEPLHSFIESRSYGYDELEAEYLLEHIADNTSERFATMVKMRVEGYTFQEIGDYFGTTHQNIRQQINYNRKKIASLLKAS